MEVRYGDVDVDLKRFFGTCYRDCRSVELTSVLVTEMVDLWNEPAGDFNSSTRSFGALCVCACLRACVRACVCVC